MRHFLKLSGAVDTTALSVALHLQPELWNAHNQRKDFQHSPHAGTSDIWVRYNDLANLTADYKAWTLEHDSVWHPAYRALPQLRPIIFGLMARCEAVRLGGVLITKIPPGGHVRPHADKGWHPTYYNVKLYLPLQTNERCWNRVGDERVVMQSGEVWYFDNTVEHEVRNEGDADRITLIVCMKVDACPSG